MTVTTNNHGNAASRVPAGLRIGSVMEALFEELARSLQFCADLATITAFARHGAAPADEVEADSCAHAGNVDRGAGQDYSPVTITATITAIAEALERVDPYASGCLALTDVEALDYVDASTKMMAWVQGRRARALAKFAAYRHEPNTPAPLRSIAVINDDTARERVVIAPGSMLSVHPNLTSRMSSATFARVSQDATRYAYHRDTPGRVPAPLPGLPVKERVKVSSAVGELGKFAGTEVAASMDITHCAGDTLLWSNALFVNRLPAAMAALTHGQLTIDHVKAIADGFTNLPPEYWPIGEGTVLKRILIFGGGLVPRKLQRYANVVAEQLHPTTLTDRHKKVRQYRNVTFSPSTDGMAYLSAFLPAVEALAAYTTIDQWARNLQQHNDNPDNPAPGTDTGTRTGTGAGAGTGTGAGTGAGAGVDNGTGRPSRSLGNYRADILMDLLAHAFTTINTSDQPTGTHGNEPGMLAPGIRNMTPAKILITIPALTLLKATTEASSEPSAEPANEADSETGSGTGNKETAVPGGFDRPGTYGHLDGYGPIPFDQAAELAGHATQWMRILTDPETGVQLSYGRTRYKPPQSLQDWVTTRDQTCRGIGCDKPATNCDIDHTIPYNRPTTVSENLTILGTTDHGNLGALCKHCHHQKDNPGSHYHTIQTSPGHFTHTLPTGRTKTITPDPPPF